MAGERYVFWTEQNSAGRNLSLTMVNTAFSKDIMKDRATTFNVIFSILVKEIRNHLPSVSSYSEYQWRKRQLIYRLRTDINKKKMKEIKCVQK
jgi:hypothetical protein